MVGTNRGLVRFHPDKNDIRVFTTKDGLLGNQFNYKSALKARNGKFYFGGIDGLVAFDPREAKTDDFVPPIYISKFSIYNKEVTVHTADSPLKECITHTDRIVLNYDESNISFDVALLAILPLRLTNITIGWLRSTRTGLKPLPIRIYRMRNCLRDNIPFK